MAQSTVFEPPTSEPASFGTLVDLLRHRAEERSEQNAYLFLTDGEVESERLAYAELDLRARAIAARLQELGAAGERALLFYPAGLDFIAAFFGCLYAGVTAVPAYPPRRHKVQPRLRAIVADCRPAVCLTTAAVAGRAEALGRQSDGLQKVRWLATDALAEEADAWRLPEIGPETLAFLQYTSGSTGSPKGVRVSHGNLLHNEEMIRHAFGMDAASVVVGWLPLYHDMGLIGNVLQPLYVGGRCVLMSPMAFLQRPLRWLEAIARYRGTTSGGPNFAYDLCVDRVDEAGDLDLSSWTVAFNGAEPVRAATLERFAATFASRGFRRQAFYPCYGLAETTLFVTGGELGEAPTVRTYDAGELEKDRAVATGEDAAKTTESARPLVGCGRAWLGQEVVIADPVSRRPRDAGTVGEIWVAGPSVAGGYWERPDVSRETFAAHLDGDPESGPFLRTGDLGFVDDGELFVTGRLKDLIIIRGRNLYPHDLEHTAGACHPALRAGSTAAFAVLPEDARGERLVLVLEVERRIVREKDPEARAQHIEQIAEAVRRAVAEEHEVAVAAVVLIHPGTLPKTSSGKVRRRACREKYLGEELRTVGESTLEDAGGAAGEPLDWAAEAGGDDLLDRGTLLALEPAERRPVLVAHLRRTVAARLGRAPETIDDDRPLTALGLDSLQAMELAGRLQEELGRAPDLAGLLQGASLEELADELLDGLAADGDGAAPIPAAGEVVGATPLSYGQEALWFLHRLAPESAAYNIAAAARLRGPLDTNALRRAFTRLVKRHAVLRSRFDDPEGQVVQEILPSAAERFLFHVEEAIGWEDGRIEDRLVAEAHHPFDLAAEPLLRVLVFHRGDEEHLLLLVVHHIVADFWSIAVLLDELGEVYREESGGAPAALRPLEHTFADAVRFERERLAGEEGRRLESFWLDVLAGDLESLDLATDRPRPPVQTWNGASASVLLPAALAEHLGRLGSESGTTLYMTLLAAYQALLHRYTGQDDILVGSPTAGRTRPELSGIVGYFVNPLVMRGDLGGDPHFRDFLDRIRRTVLAAFRHQDYPFDLLVERLHPERGLSRPPIFQVLFTLQQAPRLRAEGLDAFALGRGGAHLTLGGLEWESVPVEIRAAQFELALAAARADDGLALTLTYNRDLFEAVTAERFLGHLGRLLEAIIAAPDTRLCALELLTPEERHQILVAWNATAADVPRELGLHELVAAQARRTPDAVAIVWESSGGATETLTYRELRHRSVRLAGRLRRLGVSPEEPVAICVERSPEMIVGLLGILEAGGAYVPLDPSYPEDRLRYMFEDVNGGRERRLLLTREADHDRLGGLAGLASRVVVVDGADDGVKNPPDVAPAVRPENLAYVIYTSGSTGRPKGVGIPHGAVVNFLEAMRRKPGVGPRDTLLAVTTLAFDIAVLEIFLPLTVGARLVLASRETAADGTRLGEELAHHGVTVMQATPATWRLLLESGWSGRAGLVMLSGGEALPADVAAALLEHGGSLWNMYGPTETTIWSAARPVDVGEAPVRVGGAIANTRLHILDARLEAVPVGVPGEMWIGGDGLARGYRGRPGLTAERFVPDPFAGEPGLTVAAPGGRLYRVGDRVRFCEDGTFEFLGRVDHQVKVRGYRIEPGEIEAALTEHAAIAQAVVVVRADNPADPRLVAYLAAEEGAVVPSPAELRSFLRHDLPDYMVPSMLFTVDAFPQTPNGKIDRGTLVRRPLPAGEGRTDRRAPRSRIERLLAELWCEVLGVESVGLDDNFFDLGGHSLLATRLHRLLVERLDRDDLTVVHLFQYPTIDALAGFLTAGKEGVRRRGGRRGASAAVEEIAVVGLAGRFPGAADVEAFWRNLRDGVEATTFFADEELEGVEPAELADERYVRARGVLDGAEDFDAAFFGFTPREAEVMDPQHRLFLEVAYEALENAACDPARYGGRIGLFAGVGMNTYLLHAGEKRLSALAGSYQAFIANDKDFVPTRVSYKLDLRGPSVNVQTACSSSLVAVHLACQSLRSGEAEMALAGGVTVRLPQRQGYLYEEGGILSADGRCRAFDEEAGGTVLGNGLGVVVLKPLAAARDDGDHILAVVKGSAINNDGALKMGYTAPSVEGQAEVLAAAYEQADVDPRSVGYVEAHGTGTALGDPIEVTALGQAFAAAPGESGDGAVCRLGSVKTNIGHLDTAAGIAGLIKATLALDREEIPPSLHFTQPNPKIPFAESPFRVAAELEPWPRGQTPRRAGVSSFGIGGTNAHVVLEEAPPPPETTPSPPGQLLVLAAKTPAALDAATRRLAERLGSDDGERLELADVAFTLHTGRQEHDQRRFVIVRDRDDAVRVLSEIDPERVRTGTVGAGGTNADHRVAFLFSGQGAQYPGMGRELAATEPVFRAELDRAAEILQPVLGENLRDLLFPDEGEEAAAAEKLRETRITQPALFAVEHALASLWMSWGVPPSAMLGHSIGEFVAATVAGVFRFEDALLLVAERGRLMQEQPPGMMLAVGLPEAEILPLLPDELSLAVVNGPRDAVVAGAEAAIEAFEARLAELEAEGAGDGGEIRRRRLHTSHAFHSAMMEPAVAPFVERVAALVPKAPKIPFVSNVTGTWITDEEATDPSYWGRHLAEPVRFAAGLRTLAGEEGAGIFLEVGPGRTLASLARAQVRDRPAIASLPHPKDGEDARQFLLGALGRLWQAGVEIDWAGFYRGRHERRRRVALPTYPFERRRFFIEGGDERPAPEAAVDLLAKKGDVGQWFYAPMWKPVAPTAPGEPRSPEGSETWWILGSGASEEPGSLVPRLAEALEAPGRTISTASVGDGADDLESLDGPPSRVVAAWPAVAGDASDPAPLLHLVQHLAELPGEASIGLDVVTRSAWRVAGGEAVEPGGAILAGFLRAVPQELPRLRCRTVDLEAGVAPEELVEDLVAELASPPASFVEAAWRDGLRYERAFEPYRLPATGDAGASRLVSGGTYLLTGGLGGVGLVLARGIVESLPPDKDGVRARLALLGRTALPERETWDELDDPALRGRIAAVRKLEALGAEVLTVAADVADRDALATAMAEIRERLGPIRGVIHAAGVAGGGLLRLRRAEDAAAVLRPKVEGTRALLNALTKNDRAKNDRADASLDFVLFCSSINAVAGGYGQADYAGANAFLDAAAAAERRGRRGPLVVSLGWDRFRGIGMAAAVGGSGEGTSHPLLGTALLQSGEREIYRARYTAEEPWVLAEHLIAGRPTVPGATYLEMARAALAGRAGTRPLEIREVVFLEPLAVDPGGSREVLTVFDLDSGEDLPTAAFRVLSRSTGGEEHDADTWSEHCRGRIAVVPVDEDHPAPTADLAEIRDRATGEITAEDAAERSSREFLVTGRRWEGLERVRVGDGELLAEITLADDLAADLESLPLHPALLDIAAGCVQLARDGDFLPLSYDRLRIFGPLPRRFSSHLRIRGGGASGGEGGASGGEGGAGSGAVTCDALLLDAEGTARVEIEGFSMRRLAASTVAGLERATAAPSPAAAAVPRGAGRPEDAVLEGTIEAAEAVEVLRRVVASRVPPHLVVSPRDLGAVVDAYAAFDPARIVAELAELDAPAGGQARPDLGTDFVAPGEGMEKVVTEVWQRYLGIDEIGAHDNFFELGGTSLVGVQVVGELKRRLGREISTVSLFEAPTVAALARLLEPSGDAGESFAETRDRASKKKAALKKASRPRGRGRGRRGRGRGRRSEE